MDEHQDGARRHERAAELHERAASHWLEHGDARRAALQREIAEHERRGASLERRWSELGNATGTGRAGGDADPAMEHGRMAARQLALLLDQIAEALERSADLAEQHAQRLRQRGEPDEEERAAAQHARDSAHQARLQGARWLTRTGQQPPAARAP